MCVYQIWLPAEFVIHLANYRYLTYTPLNPVISIRGDSLWQITSDLWKNQYLCWALLAAVWAWTTQTEDAGYWTQWWAQTVTDSVAIYQFSNPCNQFHTILLYRHLISNSSRSRCQSRSECSLFKLPLLN